MNPQEHDSIIQTIIDEEREELHLVIGVTEAGFERFIEKGLVDFYDFTDTGVPLKVTLFANKSRAGALAQLQAVLDRAKATTPSPKGVN